MILQYPVKKPGDLSLPAMDMSPVTRFELLNTLDNEKNLFIRLFF